MHTGEKLYQCTMCHEAYSSNNSCEHTLKINHIIVANVTRYFPLMVILKFTWWFTQVRNHISTANGSRHFLWRTVFMNTLRCTLVRSYINALCAMKLIPLVIAVKTNTLKINHTIVTNVKMYFHKCSQYSSFKDKHRGETI